MQTAIFFAFQKPPKEFKTERTTWAADSAFCCKDTSMYRVRLKLLRQQFSESIRNYSIISIRENPSQVRGYSPNSIAQGCGQTNIKGYSYVS